MSRKFLAAAVLPVLPLALMAALAPSSAAPPGGSITGAIFTTDVTGVPVNLNHYDSKPEVYLNGGPGINAPDSAAGLPAGTYTFQVTNPNGRVLLSEDPRECRQFTVDGSGVIQGVVPAGGCEHAEGADLEDQGRTVQLIPFADTPNPGGVYKVWVTPTERLNCQQWAKTDCFEPRYSKTDNFKVRADAIVEIDARYFKDGQALLGLAAEWTDTNGASNTKYTEYNPAVLAYREAHIEAAEEGRHKVTVSSQPGCDIGTVVGPRGETYSRGKDEYTVSVDVAAWQPGDDITYRVDVYCR